MVFDTLGKAAPAKRKVPLASAIISENTASESDVPSTSSPSFKGQGHAVMSEESDQERSLAPQKVAGSSKTASEMYQKVQGGSPQKADLSYPNSSMFLNARIHTLDLWKPSLR
jgi:hypothetical protein